MKLSQGISIKIDNHFQLATSFVVDMIVFGSDEYDFCCIGLDSEGKSCGPKYLINSKNTDSPMRELRFSSSPTSGRFTVNLGSLPENVHKLVFCLAVSGSNTMSSKTMSSMDSSQIRLSQFSIEPIIIEMEGYDYLHDYSIIGIELERNNGWFLNVATQGTDKQLSDLIASYGIPAEKPETASTASPSSKKINLKKTAEDLTRECMGKINLSKDKATLEKHVINLSKTMIALSNKSEVDLGSTKASVVVVLDYSGSMNCLYSDGTVQNTLNKLVPLGLNFDDNGSIIVYLFQDTHMRLPDMNLENYDTYVTEVVKKSGYRIGGTKYAPVLNAIIDDLNLHISRKQFNIGFSQFTQFAECIPDDDNIPTFILFITDGENALNDKVPSTEVLRRLSEMNVFIQFIGIGDEDFEYLKTLDNLKGRARDNTGFSEMPDLNKVSDEELYSTVLYEYSRWLKGLQ